MSQSNAYNGNILADCLGALKRMTSEQFEQSVNNIAETIVQMVEEEKSAPDVNRETLLAMAKEELWSTLADKAIPEPQLEGDTSVGLSVDWINWYSKKHGCRYYAAVREGKKLLKALKTK